MLITQRHRDAHQGGLWEFPGGKVRQGEPVLAALRRELEEEIGITPIAARPLIAVPHEYDDLNVWLEVWRVERWSGMPSGREGQPVKWVAPAALDPREFPPADVAVITAARLPSLYLITPEAGDAAAFMERLEQCLVAGIRLLQLRIKTLPEEKYAEMARGVIDLARAHRCTVLLNAAPRIALKLGADGVHLTAKRLHRCRRRPLPETYLVAASCHGAQDLERAHRIGADFAVLGPVMATPSHPLRTPMGWKRFAELVARARCPVYPVGGIAQADITTSWYAGGQGIAAIRSVWDPSDRRAACAEALRATSPRAQ